MGLINSLLGANLNNAARGAIPVLRRLRSVSFALYAEDVLLSHMHPRKAGFYVDVGAFHPEKLSNTYKLYLKGWSGVTVEPNPGIAKAFKKARPRDQHLTVGIASEPCTLEYHMFRDGAQNTFDAGRAAELSDQRVGEVTVPCVPLNEVFEQHCRDCPVDMLSVDCESRDLQVVQSLDWRRYRPTVLIIEDFEQFSTGGVAQAASSAIRSFMLAQDYAVASQAIFSFFYIDRHAFRQADRDRGFCLDQSQLELLALD